MIRMCGRVVDLLTANIGEDAFGVAWVFRDQASCISAMGVAPPLVSVSSKVKPCQANTTLESFYLH